MKYATFEDIINNIGKDFLIVAKRSTNGSSQEADRTTITDAIEDDGVFIINDDIEIYPTNIDSNGNQIDWMKSKISNQEVDDWFYDIFWV
jgi:hypothetical protein